MLTSKLFPKLKVLKFPFEQKLEKVFATDSKNKNDNPKFIANLFAGIPTLKEVVLLKRPPVKFS